MSNKPLVSIITPCYNGEKYLENYFEGVLSQDYENIELIFVNDGSTDSTEEKALFYGEEARKKGYNFKYIYQENAGQAAAINQGLKIFSGEYLMWMDSDDIMLPGHITEKVNFLETHPEYGFVLSQGEVVNYDDLNVAKGILKREKPCGEDNLFEDLIYEKNIVFCPGTIMVRKEAIESALLDKRIFESREGQNWQLMLPISYLYKCGYLEKVLFKCVAHPDSHSRMRRDYNEQIERILGFESILTNTINNISQMSDNEKNEWKRNISIKYSRRKLELAYQNFKFKDIRKERRELSELGYQIKLKETLLHYLTQYVYKAIMRRFNLHKI